MNNQKEKNAFIQLKKRFEGQMENDMYQDDELFYRFLRARDLNVDLAESMIRKHLEWRQKYDVKNISAFKTPEVLKKYFPGNFLGHAKNGEVVRYCPTGNYDLRGIMESCSDEHFEKNAIKIYEGDVLKMKNLSKKLEKAVDPSFVFIHNMKNITLSKLADRKAVIPLMTVIAMYLDNYPESLKAVFMINTPSYINIIYSILKSFLPINTLKKIKMYSDESWRDDLLEIIDPEVLPAFLGGERTDPDGNPLCNTFINHAGMVPEKYYRINITESFSCLPNVQRITIPRASVHEITLKIKEISTVLKWQFRVRTGDVKFGIVYQNDTKNKTEVVPMQRIAADCGTETGFYKCRTPGKHIIVFDNSYSFLRSKEVFYKVQVTSPGNETRYLDESSS